MNEDYCSYELSKALKACGFDEPCDHYYCAFDNETDVRFWSIHPAQSQNGFANLDGKVIADAPTLWQAQKWLREKKGIAINVIAHDASDKYREGKYHWMEVHLPNSNENGSQWIDWFIYGKHPLFDTYEEALSDGLLQMLKLIKKRE